MHLQTGKKHIRCFSGKNSDSSFRDRKWTTRPEKAGKKQEEHKLKREKRQKRQEAGRRKEK
ncbi:Protein CBG27203 [Caenorhabditis briggsae]|uniref:Protein CBG27203 n=1 Tax=Caenorhabditis briggsae TaxID=6238 RepID=B6IL33_CAEBR|nr:Protein CBG27203 [Caenorhabditis briggsae]CAS00666.1 Protein CBG27203 [Caenorhabditis briggsae]